MLASVNMLSLLADLVLIIHVAFVAFVVLGFVFIWVGYFCGWRLVYDIRFRLVHLVAMGVVFAESVLGLICPLTTWEGALRMRSGEGQTYEGSFIAHWLGRILFFDWSESTFTLVYTIFFAFILLTFWIVRPRWPNRRVEQTLE
jgi:hypothetical protein